VNNREVYPMVGAEGISRLVAAFYSQIPQDSILGPMYPEHDLEGSEKRLRDFLIFLFGGPQNYIKLRGQPRLGARHTALFIDQAARDRWMQLMNNALAEVALPSEVEQLLRKIFGQMSTSLINRRAAEGRTAQGSATGVAP
jgi:hemoglobin